jgi:hypothetical protein
VQVLERRINLALLVVQFQSLATQTPGTRHQTRVDLHFAGTR